MVLAVRWYVRCPLSYTEVSEWLAERGILVDQSTIYRWVQRFLPLFGEVARKYRAHVGADWRADETYARFHGRWHSIYRAIDGHGQIVDAYVRTTGDMVAARRFFERAIASSETIPRRVITDKAATYPPALAGAVPGTETLRTHAEAAGTELEGEQRVAIARVHATQEPPPGYAPVAEALVVEADGVMARSGSPSGWHAHRG